MPIKTKAKKKTARKKATVAVKKKTAKKRVIVAAEKKKSTKKKTAAKKVAKKAATAAKKKTGAGKRPVARRLSPYQRKKDEAYMNPAQLEHFRQILLNWKKELIEGVDQTVMHMKEDVSNFADPADRATKEEEFGLELRTRDRERKLLKKINAALLRIEDGSYGYCEETGEEIGIRRLEARPVATLCLEAQQRREMAKKQFRDVEDRDR